MLNLYSLGDLTLRHAVDEVPDGRRFHFHVHDRCEIYYFVSGCAEYLVEGAVYPLRRGSVLLMRPGEAHCVRPLSPEPYARYALNFPLSLFDSFDPKRLLMQPFTDRELGKDNDYFLPEAEPLIHAACSGSADDYSRTVEATGAILTLLRTIRAADRHRTDSAAPVLTNEAVSFVNAHLFDESLSVGMLAEHFYLSKSQFGRVFKKATGAAPWDYVTAKRLLAAKKLIESGTSVRRAAERCGFSDQSNFYRAFKKRFGSPPAAQKPTH